MTDSTGEFEEALARSQERQYSLRLYVSGASALSQRAVANLVELCERELPGRYTLEVIDVYQQPELAASEQVLAAPTLVRLLPAPIARLVGDMSDGRKVMLGLDIVPAVRRE